MIGVVTVRTLFDGNLLFKNFFVFNAKASEGESRAFATIVVRRCNAIPSVIFVPSCPGNKKAIVV